MPNFYNRENHRRQGGLYYRLEGKSEEKLRIC
jgi:hypothetical protein